MAHAADLATEYRRRLVLYPRRWRVQHGEALVGLLVDQAEAERRDRVSLRDRVDLLAGAIDARSAFWDPEARVAEVCLGLGLGLGLVYLGVSWDPTFRSVIGPFANPTFVPVTAWLAAYLCSLVGHVHAARRLVVVALALHVVVRAVAALSSPPWLGPSMELTAAFVVLAALAAARVVRRRALVTTVVAVPATVIAGISALVGALTRP